MSQLPNVPMSQTTKRLFHWLTASFFLLAWWSGPAAANSPEEASASAFNPKPAGVIEGKVRCAVDIRIHRFWFFFGRWNDLRQRPDHHHNPNQDGKAQEDQYRQVSLTMGL